MADYSKFLELNVQILGIGSSAPFAQKTFADSLKLPYPLLSDFPDSKVIRSYGVLDSNQKDARRAFFLVDQQGVVRQRWLPDPSSVLPSLTILDEVRKIAGKR
jgi:peroxiredoxin